MAIQVTYANFPVLRILAKKPEVSTALRNLEGQSNRARDFLDSCERLSLVLQAMILISDLYETGKGTHLFLSSQVLNELEAIEYHLGAIDFAAISTYGMGTICYGEGHQMVFFRLSKLRLENDHEAPQSQMAVAYFKKGNLLAFEECVIEGDRYSVETESRFVGEQGLPPGGYVTIVLSLLSAWHKVTDKRMLSQASNSTALDIFHFIQLP